MTAFEKFLSAKKLLAKHAGRHTPKDEKGKAAALELLREANAAGCVDAAELLWWQTEGAEGKADPLAGLY